MPNTIQAAAEGLSSEDPSLEAIKALIAAHRAAYAIDEATWDKLSKIDDSEPMCGLKTPRVPIGKEYAYSFPDIDHHIDIHLRSALSMCGSRGDLNELERNKYEAKRAAHKANLAAQKAEHKRIEDESGYTDALAAARATKADVDKVEQQIVIFVPRSITAAATLASFVCENLEGNSYLDKKDLLAVLASIGRALKCD